MGLHDAEEMLEAAREDAVRLERENAKLRAVLARVGDLGREIVADEKVYVETGERVSIGRSDVATMMLGLVDGAADSEHDLSPLSGIVVDGVRLTWQQVAADREERWRAAGEARTMLADLSRNRNGRHEGDVDSGVLSLGNPHLQTGQTIGYSIHGRFAYVVPEPHLRGHLEAWKQLRP